MYCKYCGKPIEKESRFCPHCGEAVSDDKPAPRAKSKEVLSKPDGISRKKIIKGAIAGLVLTIVCSPIILIGRGLVLDSILNPDKIKPTIQSQPLSELEQTAVDTISTMDHLETDQTEGASMDEIDYPSIPMVFTSDRDDPNFEECHPTGSCSTHVFYNPNPSIDPSVNLTMPLGFDLAYNPSLSPDGTKVAFGAYTSEEQTDHIYVINVDGSGLKKVSRNDYTNIYPAWSSDSTQLVYMSKPKASIFYNLYITDIYSNETNQLTEGDFIDRYPSWSPDGEYIALQSNRLDPDPENCLPNCKFNLFVMDVETLSGSPIMYNGDALSGGGIEWSPNGNRKAFHADWSGNWDIYIIETNGEIRQLTNSSGTDTAPRWSPDGNFITYTSETSTGFSVAVTPVDYFSPVYYTNGDSKDFQPDW